MNAAARLEMLRAMHQQNPNDGFVAYGLAMELAKAPATTVESRRIFESLLVQVPDYLPAYLQFGLLLVRLGDESAAKLVYTEGIALAQRQGDRHTQGELEGALAML